MKPIKTFTILICYFIFLNTYLSARLVIPKVKMDQKKYFFKSKFYSITATTVVDQLNHPWGIAWISLSEKSENASPVMILSERNNALWLIDNNEVYPIKNLPSNISQGGQGGWLDLLTYKKYIFLSYSKKIGNQQTTALIRFKVRKSTKFKRAYEAYEIIPWFEMNPASGSLVHFGGMLTTDGQYLFLSLGDRGNRWQAQNQDNHWGGIVRLPLRSLSDKVKNPFSLKELFSLGHRNVQGLFYDSIRKVLWATEHGPKGGDELNLVRIGKNYGWPAISYGKEYGSGIPVSSQTHKPGMEQPIKYWDPSPALSGLVVYQGREFPQWNGNLLLGSLKYQRIYRLSLDKKNQVIQEEQLFTKKLGRIRSIKIHSNQKEKGIIYLLIDNNPGKVIKLTRH